MDKPNSPGGFGGPGSSWPENSGSEQDFGATGVFGAVTLPDPVPAPPVTRPEPDFLASWATEAPKPQPAPPPAPSPIAEPVVHKVVLEGGGAANSPGLLDRIRVASADRATTADRAAAADPAAKGSGGFTELLRTLGAEVITVPERPYSLRQSSRKRRRPAPASRPCCRHWAPRKHLPPRLRLRPQRPLRMRPHHPAGSRKCSARPRSQAAPLPRLPRRRRASLDRSLNCSAPWAEQPPPPRHLRQAHQRPVQNPRGPGPSPRCSRLSSSRLLSSRHFANRRPPWAASITVYPLRPRKPPKPVAIPSLPRLRNRFRSPHRPVRGLALRD